MPETTYRYTVRARDAAGNLSPVSLGVVAETLADDGGPEPGACTAVYRTAGSWGGGYQGEVTVTAGSAGVTGWTVELDLAPGGLSQAWNATTSVSGGVLTATNVGWNGTLGAGASTSFGFIGSGAPPSDTTVTCG